MLNSFLFRFLLSFNDGSGVEQRASCLHLGGNRFLLSFNDSLFGIKLVVLTVENGAAKVFTLQVADLV